MTLFQLILIVFLSISASLRLWELFAVWFTQKTMPWLGEMDETNFKNPPKISVIIPACNEAATMEQAMTDRLLENYPNIEFILIDDRSTDSTGEIMKKLAEKDKRVKTYRIDHLPTGWLGKVHALNFGTEKADGDWLLFSDADVHLKNGTMNRVISYCLKNNLSHLCILPDFNPGNLIVDIPVSLFIKSLVLMGRTWRVKDPKSRAFTGGGAFNLVKASDFKKTEGFHWLKMELVDDVCLGLLMKRVNGFASDIISGKQWVGVRWYRTFRGLKAGMGRAFYAGLGNCRSFPLMVFAIIGLGIDLSSYAAMIPMGIPWLQWAGAVVTVISLIDSVAAARLVNMSIVAALLLPFGNIMACYLTVRAGLLGLKHKGIYWRGTFYSRDELRAGRRFTW